MCMTFSDATNRGFSNFQFLFPPLLENFVLQLNLWVGNLHSSFRCFVSVMIHHAVSTSVWQPESMLAVHSCPISVGNHWLCISTETEMGCETVRNDLTSNFFNLGLIGMAVNDLPNMTSMQIITRMKPNKDETSVRQFHCSLWWFGSRILHGRSFDWQIKNPTLFR